MKSINNINEPETLYQKSIQPFTTFNDMNEADAKEMANITGVQHLQNVTSLIKKLYAVELKKPMNKKLNF